MTKHTLKVSFEGKEGALVRLLSLVQRRGFSVEGMEMPQTSEGVKNITLTISPMGSFYRVDILQRQIERLLEVRSVSIAAQKPPRRIPNFLRHPVASFQQTLFSYGHDSTC
jgi:acetolactate synthase regulatory subunit